MYTVSVLVLAACLLPGIEGSAIPMWEYLSRGEKVRHFFHFHRLWHFLHLFKISGKLFAADYLDFEILFIFSVFFFN